VHSALLLALALAAGPGEHGRVILSASAGGGWASDPFLGAGLGGGAISQLVPAARLDLAPLPRLKLSATAELSLVRFAAEGFTSVGGAGGIEARFRGDSAEASLTIGTEQARFSTAVPLDLPGGPDVTRTGAVLVTPGVRIPLEDLPVTLRAALTGSYRASRAVAEDVSEQAFAALAGASLRIDPHLTLDLALRHERVASDRAGIGYVAWGGAAGALAAPLAGELAAQLQAGVQSTRFDTDVVETLWRVGVELSHPAGPVVAVLTWSWAHSVASDLGPVETPDLRGRTRQLVFVGVRGQARVLAW
jgi:hypothetical protein